jgi:hypothetical protein
MEAMRASPNETDRSLSTGPNHCVFTLFTQFPNLVGRVCSTQMGVSGQPFHPSGPWTGTREMAHPDISSCTSSQICDRHPREGTGSARDHHAPFFLPSLPEDHQSALTDRRQDTHGCLLLAAAQSHLAAEGLIDNTENRASARTVPRARPPPPGTHTRGPGGCSLVCLLGPFPSCPSYGEGTTLFLFAERGGAADV